MSPRSWVLIVALLGSLATAVPVHAATPARGTLSPSRPVVRWSGGPYFAPRPVGCHVPYELMRNDPTCDSFFVRVNLRERADVKVRIFATNAARGQGPSPLSGDDYDAYVWGPTGVLMAEANNPDQGVETLTFTHDPKYKGGPYEIEVIPFMVRPGSTYKGVAELVR